MNECNKCAKPADIICLGCGGFACLECHQKEKDKAIREMLNSGFTFTPGAVGSIGDGN